MVLSWVFSYKIELIFYFLCKMYFDISNTNPIRFGFFKISILNFLELRKVGSFVFLIFHCVISLLKVIYLLVHLPIIPLALRTSEAYIIRPLGDWFWPQSLPDTSSHLQDALLVSDRWIGVWTDGLTVWQRYRLPPYSTELRQPVEAALLIFHLTSRNT